MASLAGGRLHQTGKIAAAGKRAPATPVAPVAPPPAADESEEDESEESEDEEDKEGNEEVEVRRPQAGDACSNATVSSGNVSDDAAGRRAYWAGEGDSEDEELGGEEEMVVGNEGEGVGVGPAKDKTVASDDAPFDLDAPLPGPPLFRAPSEEEEEVVADPRMAGLEVYVSDTESEVSNNEFEEREAAGQPSFRRPRTFVVKNSSGVMVWHNRGLAHYTKSVSRILVLVCCLDARLLLTRLLRYYRSSLTGPTSAWRLAPCWRLRAF